MQSAPPSVIATSAPTLSATTTILPDGDYTYQSPGRRGRMNSWTVTVYRKDAAIVVSYATSVAQQVFEGPAGHAQFQTQVEGLVSDLYLSSFKLVPTSYAYTYKLGFQRRFDSVFFMPDGAKRIGGGIHSHNTQQFMPPSTAWLGLSTTDLGSLASLPAQLNSCDCTAATAMDLDNDQYTLYNVARTTDAPRPDSVPAGDLPVVVSSAKFSVTEWYDPQTLLPDVIVTQPGTQYTRKP